MAGPEQGGEMSELMSLAHELSSVDSALSALERKNGAEKPGSEQELAITDPEDKERYEKLQADRDNIIKRMDELR